jgi:hypothetical protein
VLERMLAGVSKGVVSGQLTLLDRKRGPCGVNLNRGRLAA